MNIQAVIRYEEGIYKLEPRYEKWLNVKGDNVEKWTKVCAETCIFSFFIIIKEYLHMAKRSLLYGRPSYIPLRRVSCMECKGNIASLDLPDNSKKFNT